MPVFSLLLKWLPWMRVLASGRVTKSRKILCCPTHWPVYGWTAGGIPWAGVWWLEAWAPGSCRQLAACSASAAWSAPPLPARTEDLQGGGEAQGWRNLLFSSVTKRTLLYDMYQHRESQKQPWLPFSGWWRTPPDAGLKSDPDGKLSASPGQRQCISPNSASPAKKEKEKEKTVWTNNFTESETHFFVINSILWT